MGKKDDLVGHFWGEAEADLPRRRAVLQKQHSVVASHERPAIPHRSNADGSLIRWDAVVALVGALIDKCKSDRRFVGFSSVFHCLVSSSWLHGDSRSF